ncbi:hypothetical protein B0H10DRAFT_1650709, partial [Mycena sp. CBHHK59/15]
KDSTPEDASPPPDNADSTSKKGQKCDTWSAAQIIVLIRVLMEEKKLGRQAESEWTKESYQPVVQALKVIGTTRDMKQVKSCWTWVFQIKGQYKIAKGIQDLSGFGWDATKKCVSATEQVWDAYLEKHKKHRPFKTNTFPDYDDMAILCDDVRATGE